MTFQDLFKEIQDLIYQLKPEHFIHFFSKQTLLLGFTELADLDNEKRYQWQVTLDKNQAYAMLSFCFTALSH